MVLGGTGGPGVRLAVLRFAQAGMCDFSHECGGVHASVRRSSSAVAVPRVCPGVARARFALALLSNAGGERTRMNTRFAGKLRRLAKRGGRLLAIRPILSGGTLVVLPDLLTGAIHPLYCRVPARGAIAEAASSRDAAGRIGCSV